MATITRNLKLVLEDGLTVNARNNLLKLDELGQVYNVSPTSTVQIRSASGIELLPNDASVGGAGTGGSVSFGRPGQPLSSFTINTATFSTSSVTLEDQTEGSTGNLTLVYESGEVHDQARQLFLDMEGEDRTLRLGGNLITSGGNIVLTATADTSLTLPTLGTLSTLSGVETLSNKTLDALRLSNSGHTVQVSAPTLAASYSLTLPEEQGLDGQVLARTSGGGTAWITVSNVDGVGEELTSLWTPALGGTVTVAHPHSTRQLMVEVLDTAADYATIEVEVSRPDDNTIRLVANPAPTNNWLIIIKEIK